MAVLRGHTSPNSTLTINILIGLYFKEQRLKFKEVL